MAKIKALLISIFVFNIIILIHELGHFIFAKKFGVSVSEFSVGMGPCLFKFNYNGTKYSLRLLFIGGYVKIKSGNELEKNDEIGSLESKSSIKRAIIIAAGSVMNLFLGFILILIQSIYIEKNSDLMLKEPQPVVRTTSVLDGKIKEANNDIILIPKNIKHFSPVNNNFKKSLFNVINRSCKIFANCVLEIFTTLKKIIMHQINIDNLSGPVGITAKFTNIISKTNFYIPNILILTAVLSINLGIVNLFPFPILDGGYLLLVAIEVIAHKKFSAKAKEIYNMVGITIIGLLFIYVLFNDITHLLY